MAQRLGQEELLERGPMRRLVVRKGDSGWWGIDPSTRGVSIAHVAPDGTRGVSTVTFEGGEGGKRLAAILRHTRGLAVVLAGKCAPGVIVVEQPSGKRPNPSLSYAVGVVMAAVCEAIPGVKLETVPSATWKRVACGRGDIRKPKPSSGEEYAVLTWAKTRGYAGKSYDEVDAMGVAEYARKTIALEER